MDEQEAASKLSIFTVVGIDIDGTGHFFHVEGRDERDAERRWKAQGDPDFGDYPAAAVLQGKHELDPLGQSAEPIAWTVPALTSDDEPLSYIVEARSADEAASHAWRLAKEQFGEDEINNLPICFAGVFRGDFPQASAHRPSLETPGPRGRSSELAGRLGHFV
jgi:hypothetical protein